MNTRRLVRTALFLACGASLLACGDAARAEEPAKKPRARKVASWGELTRPVKDSDFYEITYFKKTGRGDKVKIRKTKAFLKVTSKSLIYQDSRVSIAQLEADEDVRIFGKPVSSRVPDHGGVRGGVDSQIQNARVVLSGDVDSKLPFNEEFLDPKAPDHKWLEARVTKSGGGLWVKSLEVDNRVTMAKGAPILKRAKVDSRRLAALKGRVFVQFFAFTTSERPETGRKADENRDSFRAAMLVILDHGSLASVYPLMWKR